MLRIEEKKYTSLEYPNETHLPIKLKHPGLLCPPPASIHLPHKSYHTS